MPCRSDRDQGLSDRNPALSPRPHCRSTAARISRNVNGANRTYSMLKDGESPYLQQSRLQQRIAYSRTDPRFCDHLSAAHYLFVHGHHLLGLSQVPNVFQKPPDGPAAHKSGPPSLDATRSSLGELITGGGFHFIKPTTVLPKPSLPGSLGGFAVFVLGYYLRTAESRTLMVDAERLSIESPIFISSSRVSSRPAESEQVVEGLTVAAAGVATAGYQGALAGAAAGLPRG